MVFCRLNKNMASKEPWYEKWQVVDELGGGGQGLTYKVMSRSDGTPGVLKKLKNNKRPQSRGRMHREVTSLDVLANAGLKVPRVFDGNTAKYQDNNIQLYFVMEYVPGRTLRDEVEAS